MVLSISNRVEAYLRSVVRADNRNGIGPNKMRRRRLLIKISEK